MNKKKLTNRTPHFGRGISKLFSFKELEHLLNLRPFVNTARFIPVFEEGEEYSWRNTSWSSDNNSWPIPIVSKLLNKTTAYLKDCSRVNYKINSFCEKLEKMFNCPVDCHIYFSFKKNALNFGRHNDKNDNFITVINGSIQCEIWHNNKVLKSVLKSGDYAFIPALVDHKFTPLTSKRLSLSFPIVKDVGPEHFRFEDRQWIKL